MQYNKQGITPLGQSRHLKLTSLGNEEGANAERCFNGNISRRSPVRYRFRCVCPPNEFGEYRIGNSSQSVF